MGTNAPMVRKQRHESTQEFDVLGTPLTYRDLVSRTYRGKRMGLNEGFFGAVSQRTGFNHGTNWYRTRAQAEIALLETLIPLTALAVLRKKIARGQAAVAPPKPRRPVGARSGRVRVTPDAQRAELDERLARSHLRRAMAETIAARDRAAERHRYLHDRYDELAGPIATAFAHCDRTGLEIV